MVVGGVRLHHAVGRYSTGSSIMPQKKNPDFAELIRGKSGRVVGDLVALMMTLKSLPLAYNKDLQEDKEGAMDAADTLEDCYTCAAGMIATMTVNADAMAAQAKKGYLAATDVADYLAKKGLPFREAYMIVGRLVNLCIKNHETLDTLTCGTSGPSATCSTRACTRPCPSSTASMAVPSTAAPPRSRCSSRSRSSRSLSSSASNFFCGKRAGGYNGYGEGSDLLHHVKG